MTHILVALFPLTNPATNVKCNLLEPSIEIHISNLSRRDIIHFVKKKIRLVSISKSSTIILHRDLNRAVEKSEEKKNLVFANKITFFLNPVRI